MVGGTTAASHRKPFPDGLGDIILCPFDGVRRRQALGQSRGNGRGECAAAPVGAHGFQSGRPEHDEFPPVEQHVDGLGFDVHSRDADRALWLGGVRFDGVPGLAGHSDGDAVCHAVADALLGAAAQGDIGEHFPETDPAIAGIAGVELLRRTVSILAAAGHAPVACDLTVLCDVPPIAPHRDAMREQLADALGVGVERVSVKATRPEGLGMTGDGVGCFAVVTVR